MFCQHVLQMETPPAWFADSSLNKIPIIIFLIWTAIGYELVIYMAAMQNISPSLYEAAEIDGASGFCKITRITFPLISPTTFYLVIVRLIATFKLFTAVNIMTFGTPARANTTIVTRVYEEAFNNYKFGYASAEAWVLVAIILIITLINFWGQKKWVHYWRVCNMGSEKILPKAIRTLIIGVIAVLFLLPLLWMISASFKAPSEVFLSTRSNGFPRSFISKTMFRFGPTK